MTSTVSIVKQKKTLIHLYFLDHEPGRVSCKDGDGISDTFKRLGWRPAVEHCNDHLPDASCELRPQRPRLPQRAHARAVL